MINQYRGEVALVISGKQLVMRPTFNAIAEIESECGAGILKIAQKLNDGSIKVSDIITIIMAGLKAGENDNLTRIDIENQIIESGVYQYLEPVSQFIAKCICGYKT